MVHVLVEAVARGSVRPKARRHSGSNKNRTCRVDDVLIIPFGQRVVPPCTVLRYLVGNIKLRTSARNLTLATRTHGLDLGRALKQLDRRSGIRRVVFHDRNARPKTGIQVPYT